jgi:hypothetical protein
MSGGSVTLEGAMRATRPLFSFLPSYTHSLTHTATLTRTHTHTHACASKGTLVHDEIEAFEGLCDGIVPSYTHSLTHTATLTHSLTLHMPALPKARLFMMRSSPSSACAVVSGKSTPLPAARPDVWTHRERERVCACVSVRERERERERECVCVYM